MGTTHSRNEDEWVEHLLNVQTDALFLANLHKQYFTEPAVVFESHRGKMKLMLGDGWFARDVDMLSRVGVKRVVNCAQSLREMNTGAKFYPRSFQYMGFAAEDGETYPLLQNHFNDVQSFYLDARSKLEPVFVHCVAGINRSATMVIALLIVCEKMTLSEAVKHVASQRGIKILYNEGFRRQLVQLARKYGKLR